jgi:serine/threonine protein kinase
MQNDHSSSYPFICPHCQSHYNIFAQTKPNFCPFCSNPVSVEIKPAEDVTTENAIGPYQLIHSIGKGGMGEVFLAYDTSCGRRIALKKIRSDLKKHPQIYNRFLKEARITSQLTHPAIIPIYMIHGNNQALYYTMPFVEGETLKQIIRTTRQQEKKGEKLNHVGGSIPALMRIFMTICQAVAYAHSKGVLHRDLKPENIIIGKYGEVLILDWGLAKLIHSPIEEDDFLQATVKLPKQADITHTGKIVGTIAYMSPERAFGHPATIQTDIYSLGIILYQLLALRNPFKRGTLEEFKKTVKNEKFIDPILVAPYRDIPRLLSQITEKCLVVEMTKRYHSVDELIHDLENYMEGRSEWFQMSQLDVKHKQDWEFQENVLIAEHVAITRITEEAEWVSLMVSRSSFAGNIKIEAHICLGENSHGIGFLLSIPETVERRHINDGYCLWLGSDQNRLTKLLRSNVEVMLAPDIFLKRQQWYSIRIEKVEQTIHVYINDILQFSYIAHIPLIGTHIGLLSRDADFEISPIQVYVGSLNIMVNCLAVPDAFLAHRDFTQALSEYRRIAYSFPDRVEGREALFRAGLTFIEQAKEHENKKELLDQALEQFEKLHGTPGAPLEYLGKALVYQALGDYEEEIKCFELAYRRYPKHPLLLVLQEQILSRMHELSRRQRLATYNFILLTVRHLPPTIDTHTRKLFTSLQKHWEQLPFIEENPNKDKSLQNVHFAIQLAFWLAKPYILGELIDQMKQEENPSVIELGNALFCLAELGAWEYAQEKLDSLKEHPKVNPLQWEEIKQVILCHQRPLNEIFNDFFQKPIAKINFSHFRCLLYFLDQTLDRQETQWVYKSMQNLQHCEVSFDQHLRLNIRWIWAYLLDKEWQKAGELIYAYPLELLNQESTALHFLYGCWLQATEGKEMAHIHFTGLLDVSYPRSWTLASHYLAGELTFYETWFERAFLWEKRQLYRQLSLYYHCLSDKEKENHFKTLYQQQFMYVEP